MNRIRRAGRRYRSPLAEPRPTRSASSLLRRLVLVEEGELPALLWSAAYFFFLLCGYYILRPVREAMGIERGAEDLPWLMTGTMAAMFLANPVFAALVSRFPRRVFIPWTYRFFVVNLLVFFALLASAPEGESQWKRWLGYGFYVWVSVFNLFAVSVFWSFMADIWKPTQSKRLFGFIGVGGTLGAIAGASMTAGLAKVVGTFPLLLVSACLIEIAAQCASRLIRVAGLARGGEAVRANPEPGPGVLEGLRLVARSPYLLLICVYLFLYALLSTFLYLEQGRIVADALPDRAARTALFAQIDLWVNVLTVVTQVFLTGRFVTRFGVGPALAILPMVTALGFTALWLMPRWGIPALTVLIGFQVARRGLHYAISQPTRQMLFTVLGQDERYKSKPFIDTFVYRAGDLVGAWTPRQIVTFLGKAGIAAGAAVPLVAVPVSCAALVMGVVLGGMQRRRALAREKMRHHPDSR